MSTDTLWTTKLHARLHDPVEKPLVLMRIPGESHENGTSADLRMRLFGQKAVPASVKPVLAIADRWASAADRPNFPREEKKDANGRPVLSPRTGEAILTADWANVRFAKEAELIHPLSGHKIRLGDISDIGPQQIKAASLARSLALIEACADDKGVVDHRLASLALWRFSSEWSDTAAEAAGNFEDGADLSQLHGLWSLLPADTRTPDHTIWQHLDLASAFSGALHGDETPALMVMSIGPVQDFIAASRSTSDLWAGSHLLSRIAWEGMRVICEQLGPDALLMPQLRGVPQVDLWLLEQGIPAELFGDAKWLKQQTDANPLFAAALPNKWLAIVPHGKARELASACESAMRGYVQKQGLAAYEELLKVADLTDSTGHGYQQVREQLQHFPELHWACVPWSLAGDIHVDARADTTALDEVLDRFYPEPAASFTRSTTYRALTHAGGIELEGWKFWQPNPGLLYPALYDLVERGLAAAKSLRPFQALDQHGYRCALTGEAEWLTPQESLLQFYKPEGEALWSRVAQNKKSWVREGERLGAMATLKRLWPVLFIEELKTHPQLDLGKVTRFVVSTHTMAMSSSMSALLAQPALSEQQEIALQSLAARARKAERVALPARLSRALRDKPAMGDLAYLPGLMDDAEGELRGELRDQFKTLFNATPEAYYGLLLMDGDRMGQWISGANAIPIRDTFHSRVQNYLQSLGTDGLKQYLAAPRAVSPAYHTAISGALNRFSLELARMVVEDQHTGRLLYAGGDDVMAMTSVDDLLSTCLALRCIYSGMSVPGASAGVGQSERDRRFRTKADNGFAYVNDELTRMMGTKPDSTERAVATASTGAVIAHHMSPLNAVLRELRATEQRAKNAGGRNAFSLTVIKRSGGALYLTLPWNIGKDSAGPLEHLRQLANAMKHGSRRAVFNIMQWVKDLPLAGQSDDLLRQLLQYQFDRQSVWSPEGGKLSAEQERDWSKRHAENLITALNLFRSIPGYPKASKDKPKLDERNCAEADFIYNYLSVADFLAREERGGSEGNA